MLSRCSKPQGSSHWTPMQLQDAEGCGCNLTAAHVAHSVWLHYVSRWSAGNVQGVLQQPGDPFLQQACVTDAPYKVEVCPIAEAAAAVTKVRNPWQLICIGLKIVPVLPCSHDCVRGQEEGGMICVGQQVVRCTTGAAGARWCGRTW